MPDDISYGIWEQVGQDLHNNLYKKRYINPEQYLSENPMEPLVVLPDITQFFGTKCHTIFIVSVPYGWKKVNGDWIEEWPPEGFEAAKARHRETYNKFNRYETRIYMDFYIVSLMEQNNPDSKMRDMMNATKGHLQDLCDELVDYGFIMMPDITTAKDAAFFKDEIDEFFGITQQ